MTLLPAHSTEIALSKARASPLQGSFRLELEAAFLLDVQPPSTPLQQASWLTRYCLTLNSQSTQLIQMAKSLSEVGKSRRMKRLACAESSSSLSSNLVSRIIGHSSSLDMNLSLDIAVDIYPVNIAQNLTLQIASTLGMGTGDAEGAADGDRDAWRMPGSAGLADEFDYVMYGKVCLYVLEGAGRWS